jgi:diamine N-acetyltransferase
LNKLEISIVLVNPENWLLLQSISRATFKETFSAVNSPENMHAYLTEALSELKMKEELAHLESEFYFAYFADEVIGYLKINWNTAQTENCLENALEIERIYLLKEFHGKGIGQKMLNTACEKAIELQKAIVWLGVWQENYSAIAFYKNFGFEEFGQHVFWLGEDQQTDLLMRKNLEGNNLDVIT